MRGTIEKAGNSVNEIENHIISIIIFPHCLAGESFSGSVDKRLLAIDIKDIVKKM